MKILAFYSITLLLLSSSFLSAKWKPEFNWTPCGNLNVGDRGSELESKYESSGELRVVKSNYINQPENNLTGRWVSGHETFIIKPANWRGGPALVPIVIQKCVDPTAGPVILDIKIGNKNVGRWKIKTNKRKKNLYNSLFVIPTSVWLSAVNNPREVPVTISSAKPFLSLGYRFFSVSDLDCIGRAEQLSVNSKLSEKQNAYIAGLLAEADNNLPKALAQFTFAASSTDSELARHSRIAARRAKLRIARSKALKNDKSNSFDTHYNLGLYAAACECWTDALEEFQRAVEINPTHAEATYRLAEAMEYNRMPVEKFAPVYERAGMLGEDSDCNVEDVFVAIHSHSVSGMCKKLSQKSLEELKKNWHYVEQMVYGASLGAFKMNTRYRTFRPGDPEWVMQTGWIFLPPDETVPVQGSYDYSIGIAEYGSSHAGGADCGVNGSGGAQIGAQRGWEVFLHEWNHEYDWAGLFSEVMPGYPTTHDSDGCGKKPIVNMGCGHRSSMRYYITPEQFRRHQPADPVVPEAFVSDWSVGPVVSSPMPPEVDTEDISAWLIEKKYMTSNEINRIREEYKRKLEEEKQLVKNPPAIKSFPKRNKLPAWSDFLRAKWHRIKLLDKFSHPKEQDITSGKSTDLTWLTVRPTNDFVDLLAVNPDVSEKCVGYARTFIYSFCEQEVRLWLGFNDTAAFWLNGKNIYKGRYYACAKWEDKNRPYMLASHGLLKKGWNVLAAKTERGGGDWGFSVHIVDRKNSPVKELYFSAELPDGTPVASYVPPAVGHKYHWQDVKNDYTELLPALTAADLDSLTGFKGISISNHQFFVALPDGQTPLPGSRYIELPDESDRELNNYLNWDYEHAMALRYKKDGKIRDLLMVRPEYFEEFLTLLKSNKKSKSAKKSILGYMFIPECHYSTTPNFTGRTVMVIDTILDNYPIDDLDLLTEN